MNQAEEMPARQRCECGVCADWLSAGDLLSQAAMVLALGVMIASLRCEASTASPPLLGVLFVLIVVERYAAIRVAFDARLFARLASGDLRGLPCLDSVLASALPISRKRPLPDLSMRMSGAYRLYRLQAVATLLLAALNGVAWWSR